MFLIFTGKVYTYICIYIYRNIYIYIHKSIYTYGCIYAHIHLFLGSGSLAKALKGHGSLSNMKLFYTSEPRVSEMTASGLMKNLHWLLLRFQKVKDRELKNLDHPKKGHCI